MVDETLGTYNEFPVTIGEPPETLLYQSVVLPAVTVPRIYTGPEPHLLPFTAVGGAGIVFIPAITGVLEVEMQPQASRTDSA